MAAAARPSLVATLLPLLLAVAAEGQALRGAVVHTEQGSRVAGAVVELVDEAGTVVQRASAGDGSFVVRAPAAGVFALVVRAEGFETTRTPLLELAEAVTLPVEVRVRPAPRGGGVAQPLPPGAGVHGRVLEAGTGAPVPGATVSLVPPGRGRRVSAVAGEDGAFVLVPPAPGVYEVRAERTGYHPATAARLPLTPGDTVVVEVSLSTSAILLAPVTVVAASRRFGDIRLAGFEWRRRSGVSGRFLGPAEIRRINPARISDILIQARGVEISGSGWRRTPTMRRRMTTFTSGVRCIPNVYLDGIMIRMTADTGLDELVSASSLAAVEVYEGPAFAPAEFPPIQDPFCGVVVLWTRLPEA